MTGSGSAQIIPYRPGSGFGEHCFIGTARVRALFGKSCEAAQPFDIFLLFIAWILFDVPGR